jgi:hypothetical protein
MKDGQMHALLRNQIIFRGEKELNQEKENEIGNITPLSPRIVR